MTIDKPPSLSSWKLWAIGSFLWGFLEGTVFFIIPDVLISFIALQSFRFGVYSASFTLLGSLIGAMCMMQLASLFDVYEFLIHIPLISDAQIHVAQSHLEQYGAQGVMYGPTTGIPHKIYSLYASLMHLSPVWYLWYSALSRYARFLIVALGSVVCSSLFPHIKTNQKVYWLTHISFWSVVYILYIYFSL
jgi:membrane protein YqaA with SNARE-associated domain